MSSQQAPAKGKVLESECKEGPLYITVANGNPYLALEVSPGDFHELMHVNGRPYKPWALIHWIPDDPDHPDNDCSRTDDVKMFNTFAEGLVALAQVLHGPFKPTHRISEGLTDRETHTILAGLRFVQGYQDCGGLPKGIDKIASNGGKAEPLDHDEIDALCEKINCRPMVYGSVERFQVTVYVEGGVVQHVDVKDADGKGVAFELTIKDHDDDSVGE